MVHKCNLFHLKWSLTESHCHFISWSKMVRSLTLQKQVVFSSISLHLLYFIITFHHTVVFFFTLIWHNHLIYWPFFYCSIIIWIYVYFIFQFVCFESCSSAEKKKLFPSFLVWFFGFSCFFGVCFLINKRNLKHIVCLCSPNVCFISIIINARVYEFAHV